MRASRGSQGIKPMPGTRPARPVGMENYIVTLKEGKEARPEVMGRRELYEAGVARTAEFQRKLRAWLDEQGVSAQVAAIGEPTIFPMIMLTCTPAVAKMIETLPEVDSVLRDSEDLRIIR